MIVSKTPLRIPFCGGLSDLKKYAKKYGGATVSITVDKYIYVAIKENMDGYFNLKYKDAHEKLSSIHDVKNDLIREALILAKMDDLPVDIYIMADLNSESGLGSSGSLTVGLLNAMHAYKREERTVVELIEEAARIEIDILNGASGFHDPAICALGGLNLIEYDGKTIKHTPIPLEEKQLQELENSLMFFYNGRHFKTKPSLDLLNENMSSALDRLAEIKELAFKAETALSGQDFEKFGKCLFKQQQLKQKLPGKFKNSYVKDLVSQIRELGGYPQLPGGKVGSFVMIYALPENQAAIRAAVNGLEETEDPEILKNHQVLRDLKEIRFAFSTEGTKIMEI